MGHPGRLVGKIAASLLIIVATAVPALSQHGGLIDANSCFSSLLQNHFDFTNHEDLKYRLFSLWNMSLFEDARMSSGAITPYGEGNFDASQTKVLRELQEHDQSIDYNKDTAIHVARLDQQAEKIIHDCLDHMTSGYGAFSRVEEEDQRYLNLTIYWRDPSGNPLKIKKQEVFNANVLDDHGSHPSVPFESGSRWSDPEIPSGSSRTVRLERTGPYQRVVFTFVVSPDIVFEKIYVDPVAEKVTYTRVEHPDFNGAPLYRELMAQTWVNNNGLGQTWDDGKGHKHYSWPRNISALFPEIADDPTAVFTDVQCEKYGAFSDLDGADPPWNARAAGQGKNTRDAICSGWWQEPGVTVKMKVSAKITGYEPIRHTWVAWYPPKQN